MNIDARRPNEAGDIANRGLICPPLVYLMSFLERKFDVQHLDYKASVRRWL